MRLRALRVVVDVANSPSFADQAAMDFFQTAGKNLAAAEAAAGIKHHVALFGCRNRAPARQRLFPRQTCAREPHQERAHSIHNRPCHPPSSSFLRQASQAAIEGDTVRLSHSLFQPMAAEDVATAVAEAAVAEPVNGTIEIAGPDAFPIDEIVGKVLEYDKDPRTVVVDPEALYFGVKLNDQSLIPGPNSRHGSTKFDWWLTHVPPQKK